jgi:hypothetical protein
MAENFLATHIGIQIITIIAGLALLVLGRKLFWLGVGVIGFMVGLSLTLQWADNRTGWVVIIVAVLAGIIGAALASLAQKIAIGLAGFLLGGYMVAWLLQLLAIRPEMWMWVLLIIGGIIGAVTALSLLEPALIGLTAVAGATLVAQALNFGPVISALLFVALLVIGVIIQAKMLPQSRETG